MDARADLRLVRAGSLGELIKARAEIPHSRVLGGGTDLLVNIRRGIVAPPVLIDINNVEEMRAIEVNAQGIEIGAAVRLTELAAHPAVMPHYPVLAQAAAAIAGP